MREIEHDVNYAIFSSAYFNLTQISFIAQFKTSKTL